MSTSISSKPSSGRVSGETPHEALAGLATFAEQWRTTKQQVVAIFEHEFEQTIRYFALTGVVREVLRTTSLIGRTNRKLRHKFRQAGCFSSSSGVKVAVYIQVTRLYAQ